MRNKSKIVKIVCQITTIAVSLVSLSRFDLAIANESPSNSTENPPKNDLIGTEWQLISWTENQELSQENSTLMFAEDRLSGSGSCNRYTGGYAIQENAIKVGLIAATRKACPEEIMNQEFVFLSALEGAKLHNINAEGELQIAYIREKEIRIMTFKNINNNNKITQKTVYISPKTVDCIGVAPRKCLQIKEKLEDKWTLFYGEIEGFNYEPGNLYQVKIVQKKT